jgi:hypothetical protein
MLALTERLDGMSALVCGALASGILAITLKIHLDISHGYSEFKFL